MNLKEYLLRVEKSKKYRIKSIVEIGDDQMDVIEKVLIKYRPKTVARPKKLMYQTNPLGFTGVKNAEMYIIDIELTVPVAPQALEFELEERLGLQLRRVHQARPCERNDGVNAANWNQRAYSSPVSSGFG